MQELNSYREYLKISKYQEIEVEAEKKDLISVGVLNNEPTGMSASQKTSLFVRVSSEKATGMTYVQDLDRNPKDVIEEAYQNSFYVNSEKPEAFNKTEIFFEDNKIEHSEIEEIFEKAKIISDEIYKLSKTFSYVQVLITENIRTMGIVNTYGLDKTSSSLSFEISIDLTNEINAKSFSFSFEKTFDNKNQIFEDYFIDKIKEWLALPKETVRLEKNNYKAVLDSSVMCNIFLTAWQIFGGDKYISRGTPIVDKLGEKIGNEIVNIFDMPLECGMGYAKKFDCEGTETTRNILVENGKLVGLMHNLDTAEKLGFLPTGNGGRDYNLISDQLAVKVIPSNFILKPDNYKKNDLLKSLDNGIYIYESYDMFHSLNIASGNFAIPCKGIVYKNQIAVGEISGITISGNIIEFLNSIEKIGDDLSSLSVVMSKSFQVHSPSVLVNNLVVNG